MTQRASLILLGLVVKRGCSWRAGIHCEGVAFQANQIHLATVQEAWVGRTVRRVACDAALDFHGFVFENEGPSLIRVALETDGVQYRGCS